MIRRSILVASASLLLLASAGRPVRAQAASPRWTTTIQSGLADTFQLTLGGLFGPGPGWQSRLTTGVLDAFTKGDALTVYGWDTYDVRNRSHDFQAGIGYRRPVWRHKAQSLQLGSGWQYWRFPSVKTGANDLLIPGNLIYQTRAGKVGILATADSWTLLRSPLTKGSLVHTQVWASHGVWKNDKVSVVFKHGPAHTYSWDFYGTNGHRVMRYQTSLAIAKGPYTLEGGYRKQWGLQKGIPDNNFWQFSLSRTFTVALR